MDPDGKFENGEGGRLSRVGDCGRTSDPGRVVGSEPFLSLAPTSGLIATALAAAKDAEGGRGECGTEGMEKEDRDSGAVPRDGLIEGIAPVVQVASEGRPPLSRHFNGRLRKPRRLLEPLSLSSSSSRIERYAVGTPDCVCVGSRLDGPGDRRPSCPR